MMYGDPRPGRPVPVSLISGALGVILAAAGLGAAGCKGDGALDGDRARGPSTFQSPGGGLPGSQSGEGASRGSTGTGNGAPPPGVAQPTPSPPAGGNPGGMGPLDPGGGVEPGRLIEEGDVVKLVGSTLYVLNGYRGLQVIDVANPDAPALLSRAPLTGHPEDMFLRGTTAVALVSDHWSYPSCGAECGPASKPFHGSLVAFVDIANPRGAVVRGRHEVPGTITDSRIVGDVLYVVSQQYTFGRPELNDDGKNATTVQAFDIRDPARPVEKTRLEIARGGWQNHIHLTDRLLFLASSGFGNWQDGACIEPPMPPPPPPGGGTPTPGTGGGATPGAPPGSTAPAPRPPGMGQDPTAGPCSRITVVDIAAADGTIKPGARVDVPGRIIDRWSMDHHQGVLRVVSAPPFGVGTPRIVTFRAGSASELAPLGPGIDVPVPRPEELKAVRFDGGRVFVVTFQRIDPLFIFDLSDPLAPRKLGELETPGWVDFIEPRGDRLVALGHDQAENQGPRGNPWVLSASVYDVSDLSRPRLMSRELFGEGSATIPDQRDNWHKVFRVFDAQKLIVVPYRTFAASGGAGGGRTAPGGGLVGRVQLFDLDLPAGKVTRRGAVDHDAGIERALLDRDRVLAVSPERLQVIDIADRERPRARGSLVLTRDVTQVLPVAGGNTVLVTAAEGGAAETRLDLVVGSDPNAPAAATLVVGVAGGRAFASGNFIHVVGRVVTVTPTGIPEKGDLWTESAGMVVVDASGGKLVRRGSLTLPAEAATGGWGGQVLGTVPLPVAQLGGQALVFAVSRPRCGGGGINPSGGGTVDVPPAPSTPPGMGTSGGGAAMPGTAAPSRDAGAPAGDAAAPVMQAQTSDCPPYEADFLVVDLKDPDHPAVRSKFKIPGAAEVVGARVEGNVFYVDHFEQVPGLDDLNRVAIVGIRYFVTRVDLSNLAAPRLGPKVNVPGVFVFERSRDSTWFTVEPRRAEKNGEDQMVLNALYAPGGGGGGKAYLEGSLVLPAGLSGNLVFTGDGAFGVFGGELLSLDLSDPRNPRIAGRTTVPGVIPGLPGGGVRASGRPDPGGAPVTFGSGWAAARATAGARLVVSVDGGALVYDVSSVARPRLLAFIRGGTGDGDLRAAAPGAPIYLPAGRYGCEALPGG